MKNFFYGAGVFAAMLSFMSPPHANAQALQYAPTGTEILWGDINSDKTSLVVVGKADGNRVNWTSNGKYRGTMFLLCWTCNPDHYDIEEDKLKPFSPLAVGKSVSVERTKGGKTWTDVLTVKEKTKITIPAGEFDVFVIENKSKVNIGFWSGSRTYYFSPKLGWTVKIKSSDSEDHDWAWHVLAVNGKTGVKF